MVAGKRLGNIPELGVPRKKPRDWARWRITKIDAAAEQLKAAVRLFFANAHPVAVFSLAAASRELVATLGQKTNVRTVQAEMAAKRGVSVAELVVGFTRIANFLKHADRDPTAELEFTDEDVQMILHLACHDFGRVAGGMPVEAQVYEAWSSVLAFQRISDAPLRQQQILKAAQGLFPGVRSATTEGRRAIGLKALEKAQRDPNLQPSFSSWVKLP